MRGWMPAFPADHLVPNQKAGVAVGYLIVNSGLYLREITSVGAMQWRCGEYGQPVFSGRRERDTSSAIVTAEYTPDLKHARVFRDRAVAERFLRENKVLRFCQVVKV